MFPTLTRGAGRALRGGVAGVSTGALALLAHAEAGAPLPDPVAVVPPVLLMGLIAAGLGGRERGPWTILALVGAGQLAMHALLSMAVAHPQPHDHNGHAGDGPEVMLAAHVLATLVVVTVLTGAERAMFLLLAVLMSRLPRRPVPLPATAPLRLAPFAQPPRLPVSNVLRRRVRTRRGPPSGR